MGISQEVDARALAWDACVMREYRAQQQLFPNRSDPLKVAFGRCRTEQTAWEKAIGHQSVDR